VLHGVFDRLNKSRRKVGANFGIPLFGIVKIRFGFVRPFEGQAHRFGSPAFTCSQRVPAGRSFS